MLTFISGVYLRPQTFGFTRRLFLSIANFEQIFWRFVHHDYKQTADRTLVARFLLS